MPPSILFWLRGTTLPTDIFVPKTTYALVGDTIVWVWIDGVHTTESVTLPPGATSWNADLDSGADTFTYVVTVPGTYYFDCHASIGGHGMDGFIEVSVVGAVNSTGTHFAGSAFPNPFSDQVTYETRNADEIRVYNLVGQQVISRTVSGKQLELNINTKALPAGMYFFSLVKAGQIVNTKKLLKN
ncbi:MAG: T9SS type A sorting domain-containing protein [Flavobacteriales bacterium]|nr:T9SS type A sorting domain-containing protein [Flavobacteriales bacterium]